MATYSYNLDNPKLVYGGFWHDHYMVSQDCRTTSTTEGTLDFTCTGTQLTIMVEVYTGSPTLQASVDGGAFNTVTLPSSGTWTSETVFTGLADTTHTVTLRWHLSPNSIFLQRTGGLTVTTSAGSDPGLAYTTGFGPTYSIPRHEGINKWVLEGRHDYYAQGFSILRSADAAIRFRGNPTSISVFGLGSNATYGLLQDGADMLAGTPIVAPSGSTYQWTQIATGLDGQYHTYDLMATQGTVNSPTYCQIMLGGGDMTTTGAPTWRRGLLWWGDSILAKITQTPPIYYAGLCFPRQVCESLGYQCINMGYPSYTCLSTNNTTNSAIETFAPDQEGPQNYRDQIAGIILQIGHNDNADNMTAFQHSYTRLLGRLVTSYPSSTPIWCMNVLPTTAYSGTILGNLNAAIAAAVAAVGASNVTLIDTTGWISATPFGAGYDTDDGTHLRLQGHAKVAAQLQAIIPAASPLVGSGGGLMINPGLSGGLL